ncbi:unnamed protein product [marine sediment metagenome]|uniref:L-rhamnose mutarotase n=1 Tax=marine sediment metagenome TaxID=412755 RepID=X1J239_9ZZZZ
MERIGLMFKIKDELKEEYLDIHTRVWPEKKIIASILGKYFTI